MSRIHGIIIKETLADHCLHVSSSHFQIVQGSWQFEYKKILKRPTSLGTFLPTIHWLWWKAGIATNFNNQTFLPSLFLFFSFFPKRMMNFKLCYLHFLKKGKEKKAKRNLHEAESWQILESKNKLLHCNDKLLLYVIYEKPTVIKILNL